MVMVVVVVVIKVVVVVIVGGGLVYILALWVEIVAVAVVLPRSTWNISTRHRTRHTTDRGPVVTNRPLFRPLDITTSTGTSTSTSTSSAIIKAPVEWTPKRIKAFDNTSCLDGWRKILKKSQQ